jgi:prevent-host-death family protein
MEVGVRELRNHTTGVIEAVERGEDVVLTRHGVPIARIVPIARQLTVEEWLNAVTDQAQDTGWLEELLAEGDDDTDDRRLSNAWP